MKIKKLFIVAIMTLLSFSLMACPAVVNLPPEIVVIEDGEVVNVNEIIYEHVEGTPFDPDAMLQSLIDDQGLAGIDYIQTGVAIGADRKYNNISDRIVIETFYAIYTEIDGVDDSLLGEYKTDENGDYIYDSAKIFLISSIFRAGEEVEFTLKLTDDDNEQVTLAGKILIVEAS